MDFWPLRAFSALLVVAVVAGCAEPPSSPPPAAPRDSTPAIPTVPAPITTLCRAVGNNVLSATVGSEIVLNAETVTSDGQTARDVKVRFRVTPLTGSISGFDAGVFSADSAVSDSLGLARVRYRVGTLAYGFNLTCWPDGAPVGPTSSTWRVSALAGAATRMQPAFDSALVIAIRSTALSTSPFRDQFGNRVTATQWVSSDTTVAIAERVDSLSAVRVVPRRAGNVVVEATSGSLRASVRVVVLAAASTPRVALDTGTAVPLVSMLARAGSRSRR